MQPAIIYVTMGRRSRHRMESTEGTCKFEVLRRVEDLVDLEDPGRAGRAEDPCGAEDLEDPAVFGRAAAGGAPSKAGIVIYTPGIAFLSGLINNRSIIEVTSAMLPSTKKNLEWLHTSQ